MSQLTTHDILYMVYLLYWWLFFLQ